MKFQRIILIGFSCCLISVGFSQDFKQFERLKKRADSALNAKNYSLSSNYYEQAIHLPENEKPEIVGGLYYDMACVYSLGKEKEKALFYLEKSFASFKAKRNTTPVSASHITSDSDLEFIRNEKRFQALLQNAYPHAPLDLLNAKEISYDELLKIIDYLNDDPESKLVGQIKNKVIYWKKENGSYIYNDSPLQLPKLKNERLAFENCTFQLNFVWNNSNKEQTSPYFRMDLDKCSVLGNFNLDEVNFVYPPYFEETTFAKDFYIWLNLEPEHDNRIFRVAGCSFHFAYVNLNTNAPINITLIENVGLDSTDFRITCFNVTGSRINSNKFEKKNFTLALSETGFLGFSGNKFKNIKLLTTSIQSAFDFQNTEISGKLLMYKSSFSDGAANNVEWKDLANSHLGILTEFENDINSGGANDGSILSDKIASYTYTSGENLQDIAVDRNFNELVGLYSMFLNLYKSKSNLESYNSCFIAIKDLQSKRLKYLYESNKTFKTFFRWKLSQLLKFYVNHGTDPAQAIVISLYIIFGFGVFFFFFPSDWDTTSKKKLIQNFKDFIQKNEKGYVIPFFVLSGGFVISLINALTLSLNAFITLGFGNIPTHGIARYFCVIEGFIGWFLLSIFTVALINQVL
ncbi:MAG TPA: hypothetical protein DGG95_06480 [Cytophagales bacterium]|jgi:hypothetical protein|nr:hypothetical protein [Cytophagales bacterium]